MVNVLAGGVDVTIEKIMFAFAGSSLRNQTYSLYYKAGTLEGFNLDESAWTLLVCSFTFISLSLLYIFITVSLILSVEEAYW